MPNSATENHAVWCLSAGENLIFDTVLADATAVDEPQGDDVGWPIQGRTSRAAAGGGSCGLIGIEPLILLAAPRLRRRLRDRWDSRA